MAGGVADSAGQCPSDVFVLLRQKMHVLFGFAVAGEVADFLLSGLWVLCCVVFAVASGRACAGMIALSLSMAHACMCVCVCLSLSLSRLLASLSLSLYLTACVSFCSVATARAFLLCCCGRKRPVTHTPSCLGCCCLSVFAKTTPARTCSWGGKFVLQSQFKQHIQHEATH